MSKVNTWLDGTDNSRASAEASRVKELPRVTKRDPDNKAKASNDNNKNRVWKFRM